MKYAVLLLWAACAFGQKTVEHEGLSGLQLSSGKAELVVVPDGGAFVSFTLTGDPKRLNTMWDPARMSREKGLRPNFGASRGHSSSAGITHLRNSHRRGIALLDRAIVGPQQPCRHRAPWPPRLGQRHHLLRGRPRLETKGEPRRFL